MGPRKKKPSCNNTKIPRSTTNNGMRSGSSAEENEKYGGKDQVIRVSMKAGDETIAKQMDADGMCPIHDPPLMGNM